MTRPTNAELRAAVRYLEHEFKGAVVAAGAGTWRLDVTLGQLAEALASARPEHFPGDAPRHHGIARDIAATLTAEQWAAVLAEAGRLRRAL